MFNLSKLFDPNSTDATDTSNSERETDTSSSDISSFLGSQGAEATVDEIIEGPGKKGRVYFQGTWWPAICNLNVVLNPGEVVKVVGIDRITLMVEPFSDSE